MTELELRYVLERAAGAAEACIELGRPEHVRAFVVEEYDAAGVRRALEGTPPTTTPSRAAPVTPSPKPATAHFLSDPEVIAAADRRFAAQAGRSPAAWGSNR